LCQRREILFYGKYYASCSKTFIGMALVVRVMLTSPDPKMPTPKESYMFGALIHAAIGVRQQRSDC
jgi:hypothetical protein